MYLAVREPGNTAVAQQMMLRIRFSAVALRSVIARQNVRARVQYRRIMETRSLHRLRPTSVGRWAGVHIKKISLQVLSSLDKSGLLP